MEATLDSVQITKYSAYKDSGVDWLGSIPSHWKVLRMKRMFRDVSIKNKPDSVLLSVTQDKGVVPRDWVENRMVMPSGNLESFKYIEKGNFAISLRSFEGGLEYCKHDGIISPAYTVLKAFVPVISDFYKYLFKSHSFISEIQTSVVGIREGKNISYPELSYSFLPIPPLEEQTRIANFLDKKTEQIDKAIAQKQKLIELLKEKRQIMIHKAVTRGLNPDVPMKDSGVEWIGEIPEHWMVKKLKFSSKINSDSLPESSPKLLSINYVDIGSVTFEDGIIKTEKYFFKDAPSRARRLVKKGDTIVSTVRTYLKAIDFIDDISVYYVFSTGFAVISPNREFLPEFLTFFIRSDAFTENVKVNSKGMSYPAINSTELGNIPICLPPFDEQLNIINNLNNFSAKIESSTSIIRHQIKLLQLYKASLINSAVTGKLKV